MLWGGPEAGPEVIVTMENVVWSHDGVSQPYLSTASALCTAAPHLLPGGGGKKLSLQCVEEEPRRASLTSSLRLGRRGVGRHGLASALVPPQ